MFEKLAHKISLMGKKERNVRLCVLAVKEKMNQIMPHEIIELSLIQALREANGEIAEVLKMWKEHPELDPRIQYEKN